MSGDPIAHDPVRARRDAGPILARARDRFEGWVRGGGMDQTIGDVGARVRRVVRFSLSVALKIPEASPAVCLVRSAQPGARRDAGSAGAADQSDVQVLKIGTLFAGGFGQLLEHLVPRLRDSSIARTVIGVKPSQQA